MSQRSIFSSQMASAVSRLVSRRSISNLLINQPIIYKRRNLTTTSTTKFDQPLSENDNIKSQVINRNPRNLEQLRIEKKPRGWELDHPRKKYWNKLFFSSSSRRISARIQHNSGKIIIHVSSLEPCIKQCLESLTDKTAAELVAKVLADRCLMAGILHVHICFTEEELRKEKFKLFLDTIEKCGVSLMEPTQYYHTTIFSGR